MRMWPIVTLGLVVGMLAFDVWCLLQLDAAPPAARPRPPEPDVWAVLDEARRITREAAGS